ncbi:hypothetical protein [Paenibacillus sp. Leaf72]|uniref:hypothetical protein n=1 Tax=Paenibacillus sp. Leaf72 TaxID=1736234 RepID=UPI0006FC91DC|nr:hypothetical protein [Paenibacillus sp. Leaf72]KQN96966.1 hypothetical protein ASF12_23140 [Paenibacillus sp. Leaf72]
MSTFAIAFRAKNKADRYLPDGIDCVDWNDESSDTLNLANALLIIRRDLKKPTPKDIEDFYAELTSLPLNNIVDSIKENYVTKEVELTKEQLRIVRKRNQW